MNRIPGPMRVKSRAHRLQAPLEIALHPRRAKWLERLSEGEHRAAFLDLYSGSDVYTLRQRLPQVLDAMTDERLIEHLRSRMPVIVQDMRRQAREAQRVRL